MRILTLLTLATVLAIPLAAQEKGSDTKGKFYYQKDCKICHVAGGKGGVLTPLSKTQNQWKKVFDAGNHGKSQEPFSPKFAPEGHLLHIKTFLINHASDSPQPETCGG